MSIVVALLAAPFLALWRSYVAKILWAWFVVPVFVSAPALTTQQAYGVMLGIALFGSNPAVSSDDKLNKNEKLVKEILGYVIGAIYPLILLGVGWIVQGL